MTAPENTTAPSPAPSPPPLAGDPGFDLLNQAFMEASALGNVLLAAKIGGGMARITWLSSRVAQLEHPKLARVDAPPPPAEPTPPPPPSEPDPEA